MVKINSHQVLGNIKGDFSQRIMSQPHRLTLHLTQNLKVLDMRVLITYTLLLSNVGLLTLAQQETKCGR